MKIVILSISAISLIGFQSLQNSEKSDKTIQKNLEKEFAYVPSGNVFVDAKIASVQSFYMLKTEVSNIQYGEFLKDLLSKGEKEKYAIAQIDSLKWNTTNSMNMAYATYYHKHPAYQEYPVVNVTYDAALLYCEWLTAKYKEMYGSDKFVFRLPTKEEFIRAGRSDNEYVNYSWGTNSLRNKDGKIQCNFLQIGPESIHRDEETKELKIIPVYELVDAGNYDILAPAKSYWPNQFGIYNLNGNAAEMINQKGIAMGGSWKNTGYDVRLESQNAFEEANPSTGFRVVMTVISGGK